MCFQYVADLFRGSHDAFCPPVRPGIDYAVEDLLTEIRHANLIKIWKCQSDMQGDVRNFFVVGTVFYPRIMAWGGKERKEFSHVMEKIRGER